MVKSDNGNKIYKSLSKNESALLNAVEKFTVFSIGKVKKLTAWRHSKITNALSSLNTKGVIIAVKKDNYVIASNIPENLFKIAVTITQPSYISFWTALSYYGFTEQQPRAIQVVSTKQYPKIKLVSHIIEIITLNPEKFYGYQILNEVVIAEKEKLLVDCLYKPEKAGGMEELRKCIKNAWSEIEQKKLFYYLIKFNNKSLFARLGYLFDELGLQNNFKEKFLKNLPSSYVKLNPGKPNKKNYSKTWMVDAND